MEDRPWGEMPDTRRPINQNGVARMLKPFKVRPRQVRFGDNTFKGYKPGWFERAFRYIPECVERQGVENRGNIETTAETTAEKSRNISEQNVSAKTAENSQCFGVSLSPAPPSETSADDDDLIVSFEERAAILEYDGGLSREEAEAKAAAEVLLDVDDATRALYEGLDDIPPGYDKRRRPQ